MGFGPIFPPGTSQVEKLFVNTLSLMTSWIFVKIGSGNGLLPDGTKPFFEPITDNIINDVLRN